VRVFLTGALGFVASHLAPALAAEGHEVTGLVERGDARPPAGFRELIPGDVLDASSLDDAVRRARPEWVVHLAGQSSAAVSFEHPVDTYRTNVLGTWTLLDTARRHAASARVLIVGSGEVYGPQTEGTRVAETAPFRPVSPYALSKAAADAAAAAMAARFGLDVIRTRSFGHTGPGQRPTFAIPSFARQIAAIEAGGTEPVLRVGNLEVTRDLIDVRDVVAAYRALLERGRGGATYNVCRGEGVRLTDVVRSLVARARVPVRIEVDPARFRPADLPYLVGDPGAIATDTGWRAGTTFERTLDDVLTDWRSRAE
jgi:GDP-4-dehydro-6-deoxy-D-mannose reductase